MFDHVSTSQGILRDQPFKHLPNLIQENLVKIFKISDMKSLVTFLIEMHLHSEYYLICALFQFFKSQYSAKTARKL